MNGSVTNVICYERGLLRTGLFWTWYVMNGSVMNRSIMNVVCYEHVYYERGLFRVVCYEWSVMNRSLLNGHRHKYSNLETKPNVTKK